MFPSGCGVPPQAVFVASRRKSFTARTNHPPKPAPEPKPKQSPPPDLPADTWAAATGTETVTSIDATWERVVLLEPAISAARRFGRLKVSEP
jgi:hypothetical protein